MTATYDHSIQRRRSGARAKTIAADVGEAILNWLARVGERSAGGRAAAQYRRLNALDDAQLARLDMKRTDLLDRCFGWRAHY